MLVVVVVVEGRGLEVVLLMGLIVEELRDEVDAVVDRVVGLVVAATFRTLKKHGGRLKSRVQNLGRAVTDCRSGLH